MRDSGSNVVEQQSTPPESCRAPLACVELDRFCEGCGYNLRTLPVYRDEQTGIPLVRCTECGRYEPANDGSTVSRPWLGRAISILLACWIVTILSAIFWLGVAEGAICYATLDELTIHAGSTTQRIGSTIIRSWTTSGPLEVKTDFEMYRTFVAFVLGSSLAVAFFVGAFMVVICPHWPRIAYASLLTTMPLVACGIVAFGWYQEAPHLLDWSLPYIASHAGAQLLGGFLGIALGRAAARLTVRIFLPPSVRPRFAYLWLVDHKPLPATRGPAG